MILVIWIEDYLNPKEQRYEAANVPNDGSCLYHAILLSFVAKYGQQLEINHQKKNKQLQTHAEENSVVVTYYSVF